MALLPFLGTIMLDFDTVKFRLSLSARLTV